MAFGRASTRPETHTDLLIGPRLDLGHSNVRADPNRVLERQDRCGLKPGPKTRYKDLVSPGVQHRAGTLRADRVQELVLDRHRQVGLKYILNRTRTRSVLAVVVTGMEYITTSSAAIQLQQSRYIPVTSMIYVAMVSILAWLLHCSWSR